MDSSASHAERFSQHRQNAKDLLDRIIGFHQDRYTAQARRRRADEIYDTPAYCDAASRETSFPDGKGGFVVFPFETNRCDPELLRLYAEIKCSKPTVAAWFDALLKSELRERCQMDGIDNLWEMPQVSMIELVAQYRVVAEWTGFMKPQHTSDGGLLYQAEITEVDRSGRLSNFPRILSPGCSYEEFRAEAASTSIVHREGRPSKVALNAVEAFDLDESKARRALLETVNSQRPEASAEISSLLSTLTTYRATLKAGPQDAWVYKLSTSAGAGRVGSEAWAPLASRPDYDLAVSRLKEHIGRQIVLTQPWQRVYFSLNLQLNELETGASTSLETFTQ